MAARGRLRTFDRAAALHRAMEIFWERGYEGTSVSDLTTALGIAPPSLYAAFTSKAALFREAVTHYNDTVGAAGQRALDEAPTARAGIEAMLRHNARAYVAPDQPTGCMVTLAATTSAAENDEIRDFLATCRNADREMLRRRIDRGIEEGDLPPGTDSGVLARYVAAVMHGMALQARDGADRPALNGVVTCAMAAWDQLAATPSQAQ